MGDQLSPVLATGRHSPLGLRDPGGAIPVTGGHQQLGPADGATEGAAPEAQYRLPSHALRHVHHGYPRSRYPDPQPGDDVLVLHPRASRGLPSAPHCQGTCGFRTQVLTQPCLPPGPGLSLILESCPQSRLDQVSSYHRNLRHLPEVLQGQQVVSASLSLCSLPHPQRASELPLSCLDQSNQHLDFCIFPWDRNCCLSARPPPPS